MAWLGSNELNCIKGKNIVPSKTSLTSYTQHHSLYCQGLNRHIHSSFHRSHRCKYKHHIQRFHSCYSSRGLATENKVAENHHFHHYSKMHQGISNCHLQWNSFVWHLKSPLMQWNCFVQHLVQANSKENINALYHWSFCEGYPPVITGFPSQRASNVDSMMSLLNHHITCRTKTI